MTDSDPDSPQDSKFSYLLVSFYLIFLSFMILLFSYSDFSPHKSRSVIGGLQKNFGGATPTQKARQNHTKKPLDLDDDFYTAFHFLFEEDDTQVLTAKGTRVVLTINPRRIFSLYDARKNIISLQADKIRFFKLLADSLRKTPNVDLEIVMRARRLQSPPTKMEKKKEQIHMTRLALLAETLEQHGVDSARIAIGMQEGRKEKVILILEKR
ncbi:MAG: hypothetical protein ACTSXQ_00080 [Alphaproteobacteria bacterium]